MKKCGIYCIVNISNDKKYIGSSVEIDKRWRSHKNLLRANSHHSNHLQNAWNLCGESKFVFYIIEKCEENSLIEREQYYFDTLNPEYNISKIAGKVEMSEITRKKLSESCKGRPSAFKGRKHTEASRKKISDNHADFKGENGTFYNKYHTDEAKKILSEAKKGENHPFFGKKRPEHGKLLSGKNNYFYGKHHTDEFKNNLSLKKSKLNPEEKLLALELAQQGLTQAEIANKFNCSRPTINRIFKKFKEELNIDFRDQARELNSGENNSTSKLTWDIVDQIRLLRNQDKLPLKVISERLGLSISVISSVANYKAWVK